MKKVIAFSLAASTLLLSYTRADTGIFGSFVEIFDGNSSVYKGEDFGSGSTPFFDGADLGSFNPTDTLLIGFSEINTFKDNPPGDDVTGGRLEYRVYESTSTPGSFSNQALSFFSNSPFTTLDGTNVSGTDDQRWASADDIDLLSLTSGTGDYTVEIFFVATTSLGDRFSNNSGDNFSATFTVVPEPSSFALIAGMVSLTCLALRRRKS